MREIEKEAGHNKQSRKWGMRVNCVCLTWELICTTFGSVRVPISIGMILTSSLYVFFLIESA